MADAGYLGVTPPISTAPSNARELEVTKTLMDELKAQNQFESEEEARRRELVLGRIAALVKKFVRDVSLAKGMSEAAATAAGGKIFTFGSYRLGVHAPGSDIDTLCVFPKHVSRDDFFTTFEPMVREMEDAVEVSGVPEAFVPVIGAKISGISMDLLCASLNMSSIPDELSLNDNNLLKTLDESVVRSVNGTRLTDELLRLVPNVQVFRDALRCIKLWAQRKAIYSNAIGFLGGVAWAMLVARVCQLYPHAAAGAIVGRFFTIMSKWQWPTPVLLKQIEEGPLQVRVWNPKLYAGDRAHRMPIITPNYPSMCATHNVSGSTLEVMSEEIRKGAATLERIMAGSAAWSELFTKHEFFHKYKNYLMVFALAKTEAAATKWSGTVESRLRQLVNRLEYVPGLRLAHPFNKSFDRVVRCETEQEQASVMRTAEFTSESEGPQDDPRNADAKFKVYVSTLFVGLGVAPKDVANPLPRRLDASFAITEFVKIAKGETFDEANTGIVLRHIRHGALPDYVFAPGEREAALAKVNGRKRTKSLSGGTPVKRPRLSTASV
ncbi:unnamed protein product [Mycena citricolor]|uniref:Poly(A) polymerase n=1 Tax=Mycena citricolor TaxID=2018698 RepID=A0AAD2JZK9_9AGAR|nr:unnamed protein product [Mycena citricolor]